MTLIKSISGIRGTIGGFPRSIRGGNFKLIYNGDTTTPVYKPVIYRQQMKTMQVLDSLNINQNLNAYFSNWFSKDKDRFELYEISKDYFEKNNLTHDPKYKEIFKVLKYHLLTWMKESDFGNMSESTMIDSMFTNSMKIPKLNMPKLIMNDAGYTIESNNLHTSVGWRNKNESVWKIYIENKLIKPKNDFEVILFRPGYEVLIKAFKK